MASALDEDHAHRLDPLIRQPSFLGDSAASWMSCFE